MLSKRKKKISTVRLLEPGTSTATTELLGLAAPGVGNEQCPVVAHEYVLYLLLRLFVDVLLVKGDEGLGNGLADGVYLGGVTAALDADSHVHSGESVAPQQEDRLEGLVAENLRLDELDWNAIDLYEATAAFAVGNGHCSLLPSETLNRFYRRSCHVYTKNPKLQCSGD